jgi:hypothetical protein
MAPLDSLRMAFPILLCLLLTVQLALAQNCYYPNGDVALGMAACTSHGGSCCPLNWSCMSNGLCYLDNADYYGRYTCTDEDWASDSECPQYCTQSMSLRHLTVKVFANQAQTTQRLETRPSSTAQMAPGAATVIETSRTTAAITAMPWCLIWATPSVRLASSRAQRSRHPSRALQSSATRITSNATTIPTPV